MLKRDIFIGIIIFILFAIGLVMTLENIHKNSEQKKDISWTTEPYFVIN